MPNKHASVSACVCVCVFYNKFRVQQTGTTLVKKKMVKKRNMGATLKHFLKVELTNNPHSLFETCFVSSGWSINRLILLQSKLIKYLQ